MKRVGEMCSLTKYKKALFILPHPDDELNISAQIIPSLKKRDVDMFFVFTTNGDYSKEIGNRRIREALNSLEQLGINDDKVEFLGYSNDWAGSTHLYNFQEGKIGKSISENVKTSGFQDVDEFCYKTTKEHHFYSRENFKEDLRSVILNVMADIIICVDFDSHPDHRATSLMTEEILGELFSCNANYRPIVLKKFAYNGVWGGKRDYYQYPRVETKNSGGFVYSGQLHELESPAFLWGDRIQLATSLETKGYLLRRNNIYKAAKKHTSTLAWFNMLGALNDDVVYWWRPTLNLLFNARIEATSGNPSYINDFKLYDSSNVLNKCEPFEDKYFGAWVPDSNDLMPKIKISFSETVKVAEIRLYEICSVEDHIVKARITDSEGKLLFSTELNTDGSATTLRLDNACEVQGICISIIEYIGKPAITEIEVYSEHQKFDNIYFPCESYKKTTNFSLPIFNDKILVYSEYILFHKIPNDLLPKAIHQIEAHLN